MPGWRRCSELCALATSCSNALLGTSTHSRVPSVQSVINVSNTLGSIRLRGLIWTVWVTGAPQLGQQMAWSEM